MMAHDMMLDESIILSGKFPGSLLKFKPEYLNLPPSFQACQTVGIICLLFGWLDTLSVITGQDLLASTDSLP